MSPLYSWIAVLLVAGCMSWHYAGQPNVFAKLFPQTAKAVEKRIPERSKTNKNKRSVAKNETRPASTPTQRRPIVMSGPSGTGKSTMKEKLFDQHPDTFGFSISHTTRKPRGSEENHKEYHFVTRDEFEQLRDKRGFHEWAQFGGNYYGTSRKAVQDVQSQGLIPFFDIEMEGVKQLKKSDLAVRVCFLQPPSMPELEKRLRGRGTDSEESIQKRLKQAANEIQYAKTEGKGDKVVINDEKERAYREFEEWVLDSTRFGSSSEGGNSKKRKIATTHAPARTTGYRQSNTSQQTTRGEDDGMNNKEFAKQFQQARSGTPLSSAGKQGATKKDRRAQKAVEQKANGTSSLDSPNLSTETSSAVGGDADDDMSPIDSPQVGASLASNAGDVSDMLEKPGAGPQVLRLTDPNGTMGQAQPKPAARPFEVIETKKQRQARQKREAQREAIEAAERERKRLMEQQIRRARMAEGTSNQTKASAFKPPTENAWFAQGKAQENVKRTPAHVEELDTRDPELVQQQEPQPATQSQGAGPVQAAPLSDITNGAKQKQQEQLANVKDLLGIGRIDTPTKEPAPSGIDEPSANTKSTPNTEATAATPAEEPSSSSVSNVTSWADEMAMSEEEQLKALKEQEQQGSWEEVSTKKGKKKNVNAAAQTKADAAAGAPRPGTVNGTLSRNQASNRYAVVADEATADED